MPKKRSERLTLRLSPRENDVIKQIRASGDFEDVSTTIRFCVYFTNTLLKILPESIGQSFLEAEEGIEEEKRK